MQTRGSYPFGSLVLPSRVLRLGSLLSFFARKMFPLRRRWPSACASAIHLTCADYRRLLLLTSDLFSRSAPRNGWWRWDAKNSSILKGVCCRWRRVLLSWVWRIIFSRFFFFLFFVFWFSFFFFFSFLDSIILYSSHSFYLRLLYYPPDILSYSPSVSP